MRETCRLEVCSRGACLEERLGGGAALEDGFERSFEGWLEVSGAGSSEVWDLDLRDELGRDACARARAPKETDDRSTFGVSSSSDCGGSV
jgi:hypothetical protein